MEKLPHDVLYTIIPYTEKIMPFLGIRDDIDDFIYKIDHKRKVSKMNAEFKEFYEYYLSETTRIEEMRSCNECRSTTYTRFKDIFPGIMCFDCYYKTSLYYLIGGNSLRGLMLYLFVNKPYYIRQNFRRYLGIFRVERDYVVVPWILVVYNNFKEHLKGILTREDVVNINSGIDTIKRFYGRDKIDMLCGHACLPFVKGMDFNYNKIEL